MKALAKKLKKGDKLERCGLVLKDGAVIELDNVAEEPEQGYEIAAKDVVKYEDDIVATWHTHPNHDSNLSERDYFGFLMWPNLKHYVVGTNGVAGYIVKDGIIINED